MRPGLGFRRAVAAFPWANPALIVAVALVLRLLWALWVPAAPASDGILYDAFARSLAAGRGYAFPDGTLTAYWPVGTSAVYASLYRAFGTGPLVVAVFQAVLGAAIAGLTWRLAQRTFGRSVAGVSGWLVAVWPLLIEFTTIFASELLFIVLVLAALNVWISRQPRWVYRMILWGVCVTAAAYVRPVALPLLVLLPVSQGFVDRDWSALKSIVPAGCAAALLLIPWAWRNFELFHSLVLVSSNGGTNLWMGNHAGSSGGYTELPERRFANEAERDRYYGHEALRYIRAHPAQYARLSMSRATMTYDRETIGIDWNASGLAPRYTGVAPTLKVLSTAYWWSVLALGGAGFVLVLAGPQWREAWPMLTACCYFALFPVLTVGMDRYHIPLNPLLAILAGYALARARGQSRHLSRGERLHAA